MPTNKALFFASETDPQFIEMKLRPKFKFMVFFFESTISLKSLTSGIISNEERWIMPMKLLKNKEI